MKRKLTLSAALAFALCICIVTATAFAGSMLLTQKPDVTNTPLSHSNNPGGAPAGTSSPNQTGVAFISPTATAQPEPIVTPEIIYAPSDTRPPETASPEIISPDVTPVPVDLNQAWQGGNVVVYLTDEQATHYHMQPDCGGENPYQLTLLSAVSLGRTPCPDCFGADSTYAIAVDGSFYHAPHHCSSAEVSGILLTVSLTEALLRGKMPHAECVFPFYFSAEDVFYHSSAECESGVGQMMAAALEDEAISLGKTPCPACMSQPRYLFTPEDGFYHSSIECAQFFGGLKYTADPSTLESSGKTACPFCLLQTYYTYEDTPHFHTDPACFGGEKKHQYGTLTEMLEMNKTICPKCVDPDSIIYAHPLPYGVPDPNLIYYYTGENPNFHLYANCSDMKDVQSASLQKVVAIGKHPCPLCLSDSWFDYNNFFHAMIDCYGASVAYEEPSETVAKADQIPCPVCVQPLYYFYPHKTDYSPYFHTRLDCPSMTEEQAMPGTRVQAALFDKELCPACADGLYYCTPNGLYYHTNDSCSGMKRAEPITAGAAVALGKAACPHCVGDSNETEVSGVSYDVSSVGSSVSYDAETPSLLPGEVYLWYEDAPVYHGVQTCCGFFYATRMSIYDAMSQDKIPCPECVNTSATVWLSANSVYYHSCQQYAYLNLQNVVSASPMAAIATGKLPCPICMLTPAAKASPESVSGQTPPEWAISAAATVPPQPTVPPSSDQKALKEWIVKDSDICFEDLGISVG